MYKLPLYKVRFFFNLLNKKGIFLFLFLFIFFNTSFSQGEIDSTRDFRRNSKSIGLSLASNGYIIDFQYSKRITGFKSRSLSIELAWIKNSKEVRIYNQYGSQSKFVYGKLNHFFAIRLGYGHQLELFSKADDRGVAVNFHYKIGPSFGILKPIYYDVLRSNQYTNYISTEKFDIQYIKNAGQIYGGASFFEGIDELSLITGAFVKLSIDFNINKKDNAINLLETGVIFDLFYKKIPIMAFNSQKSYFLTLFISYRFGVKSKKILNLQ